MVLVRHKAVDGAVSEAVQQRWWVHTACLNTSIAVKRRYIWVHPGVADEAVDAQALQLLIVASSGLLHLVNGVL